MFLRHWTDVLECCVPDHEKELVKDHGETNSNPFNLFPTSSTQPPSIRFPAIMMSSATTALTYLPPCFLFPPHIFLPIKTPILEKFSYLPYNPD